MTPTLTLIATLTMTATPAPTRIGIMVEFVEPITPTPGDVAIHLPKVVGHWYIYEQNGWRWVEDDRTGAPVTARYKMNSAENPTTARYKMNSTGAPKDNPSEHGWGRRWVEGNDQTSSPLDNPNACGHQWVEGPFYLTAANSSEEPQYYPPGTLIKIQHCIRCGILRLPPELRKFNGPNLSTGQK